MILQTWWDHEQQKRYLPYTTTGKNIMAFALTEPNAGSDPSSITTSFEDRDDHFVINGKKHWIGNGSVADLLTTYAREIGGTGSNEKNISAFLVDTDSTGSSIREMKNKVGMLTVKNSEISFHNCIIPKNKFAWSKRSGSKYRLQCTHRWKA